jgi:hypothetical protein
MNTRRKKLIGPALRVAAAAVASGVFAAPIAHSGPNCTVAGTHLDLHQSTGFDVSVDASGATLGPGVLVRTPQQNSQGNITGGINGRTIDFVITWFGTKAYDHFTGTVGNDGVAHGTSTGTGVPIKLDPGSWDSITRFTC